MAEKKVTFEQAMARLEEIVKQLEQGDAPLEDALALFREKLAEAEYLSETVCTVTVLDGPGGPIEAGRDSLDTVYGALFPIWMLQET